MTTSYVKTTPAAPAEQIPVIDLGGVIAGKPGAVARAADEVRTACEDAAFFFVRNHGVAQTLIDGILAESARFHALPLEEKLKVKVDSNMVGYLPAGGQTQRTSVYNKNTRRELSASYYIRREYPAGHADRLSGKPWVFDNRWPDGLPGFQETLLAYFEALDGLTGHLLQLFSTALGMGPQYMQEHPGFSPPNPTLRLLEYQPQDPDEANLFGIGPHSDYGCITILNQGTSPGLEVLLPTGEWVTAPMLPGHFLINTGELLTRWCNDRVPATPHRVINATGNLRHSVAFLIGSRPDVKLECLPSCQGPDNPPRYAPISYGDHIAEIRRRNYDIAGDGEKEE